MKILKIFAATILGLFFGSIIGNLLFSLFTGEPVRPNRYIPIQDNRGMGLIEALLAIFCGAIVASIIIAFVRR